MSIFTLFGDVKRALRSSRLLGESVTTLFGDVTLDISQAPLDPGEHHLRVFTLFGDIRLILPREVAVSVEGSTLFGDVELADGASGADQWDDTAYGMAVPPVRVQLTISSLSGDVRVMRSEQAVPNAPAAPLLTDGSERPLGAYEGDTSRLEVRR